MRHLSVLFAVALLAACDSGPDLNSDDDLDGLTLGEETDLGTDPLLADTDGDGLDDGVEVELGTNPLAADTDNDGAKDGAELTAGTDPLIPDTDGDSFLDGVEIDHGTDGTNAFDWPSGLGQWPDNSDIAPTEMGSWNMDDTLRNFRIYDQYGQELWLRQFTGYVVLMDLSAGWCGPCQAVASTAEALWKRHQAEGFLIVHVMSDDWNYNPASHTFLNEWADQFGLSFPVTRDPFPNVNSGLYNSGVYGGSIPFMALLDRDMKLVQSFTGAGDESTVENAVQALLDAPR